MHDNTSSIVPLSWPWLLFLGLSTNSSNTEEKKKKVQRLLSIASKPSPIFDFQGFMH